MVNASAETLRFKLCIGKDPTPVEFVIPPWTETDVPAEAATEREWTDGKKLHPTINDIAPHLVPVGDPRIAAAEKAVKQGYSRPEPHWIGKKIEEQEKRERRG